MHDDVIKWKHFPHYWPFVSWIHRSPVDSPHKGQWCGYMMGFFICASTNNWGDNRDAGDLRRNGVDYDVIVMVILQTPLPEIIIELPLLIKSFLGIKVRAFVEIYFFSKSIPTATKEQIWSFQTICCHRDITINEQSKMKHKAFQ